MHIRMDNQRTGILLLYTGSPDAPTPKAVRQYLKRFLMDPYVLSMPPWLRGILVHGIIAPFRAKSSAEKYKSIWMEEGSPLVVITDRFAAALQRALPGYKVAVGSAYGAKTVADALQELLQEPLDKIVVLPLFPHFAGATRGSLLAMLDAACAAVDVSVPQMRIVPPFFSYGPYKDAMCGVAAPLLASFRPDRVVFSYHGLPVRQGRAKPTDGSVLTYEEQCLRTTELLAAPLGIEKGKCVHAYQSRFGRGWLEPLLEPELERLASSGCRRVALITPSFVTDCLETLEELDMRAKEVFIKAGGKDFIRVPCLNDHPLWVTAAVNTVIAAA